MLNRITVATIFALLVGLFTVSTASAAQPSDRDPIPPPTDYWQDKGFILMAHQGGEWDFPPNTMFAYKSAIAAGADMIDMDAYVTEDGKIVLTHDKRAARNSDAPDDADHEMKNLTLAELKAYDFAYKWTPHDSPDGTEPPFRGIATGDVPPPSGFTAEDFQIPTFGEVLEEFPNVPINIELKEVPGVSIEDTVNATAAVLAAHPGHDENVIINSFGQPMLEAMAAARPQHKSFGGSLEGTAAYVSGSPIIPTPVAVEPPDYLQLGGSGGPWLRTVPILKPWADHDGYKIYVWGSDHNPAQDTGPFYAKLISEGADSYNTPSPTRLAKYLCFNGIARPDGSPRCAAQICPEGQTGIAPDDCVDIPPAVCPEGQTGTPPNCIDIPVEKCPEGKVGTPPDCLLVCPVGSLNRGDRCDHIERAVKVSKVRIGPKRGKIRAGKKFTLKVRVRGSKSGRSRWVKLRLRSSNRRVKLRRTVMVRVRAGKTTTRRVIVRARRHARGKARIKATASGKRAHAVLKVVNPLYKGRGRAGNNPLHTGK